MQTKLNHTATALLAMVTYLLMITTNVMANALQFGGTTTGAVSDAYPNLFAPAGITFTIWFFIYVGLFMYSLFLIRWKGTDEQTSMTVVLDKVGMLFIISNILNMLWILCWHSHLLELTMLLMILLLLVLIRINLTLSHIGQEKSWHVFVRIPFSFYFGWISVATIANATTLFVSWGWHGWPFSESIWTSILLLVGICLVLLWGLRFRDATYAVPFIWAYAGILIKHVSPTGFAQQHILVLQTVQSSLVVLIATFIFLIRNRQPSKVD